MPKPRSKPWPPDSNQMASGKPGAVHWHYRPVLMRKPGALRNGAPFKDWDLPPALAGVRAKLAHHEDGDRQFVKVLARVPEDGMAAVEAACAEALAAGLASGDVILAILARQRQPPAPPSITTPEALKLAAEPAADCARYDRLRPSTLEMTGWNASTSSVIAQVGLAGTRMQASGRCRIFRSTWALRCESKEA